MKNLALTIMAIFVIATCAFAQLPSLTPADTTFLTAFFSDTTGGRVPPDPNAPITERVFREFWIRVVNGLQSLDSRFMWVPSISRKDGKPTAVQAIIAHMDSLQAPNLTSLHDSLAAASIRIDNLEIAFPAIQDTASTAYQLADDAMEQVGEVAKATMEKNRKKRELALKRVRENATELRRLTALRLARLAGQ